MNKNQIQDFLVSKESGLANKSFTLACWQSTQVRQWYTNIGAPCDQPIPASHVIYYASQIYGINPQVVLATLQKEQSLITAKNPTDRQLSQAMGYGCPTTGSCDDGSNFSYQIDNGAWVLRKHYERANKNMDWWKKESSWTCGVEKNFYKPSLYPNQAVRFYDEDGVHYRTHAIANAATSSLYCYTPHAYNNPQGLYGRPPFGTIGRYYSGSYNFVLFFEQWFGSTVGCPNVDANYIHRLYRISDNDYLYTQNPVEVCSAVKKYGYSYEGRAMTSLHPTDQGARSLFRLSRNGIHFYTTNSYEVTTAMEKYNYTYEGVAYYVNANPSPSNYPVYRLSKNGNYVLTVSAAEKESFQATGYSYEGAHYYAESPGATIPIYRLSKNGIHMYTASAVERDMARIFNGFSDQGVAFYAESGMTGDTSTLYRLERGSRYLNSSNINERALARVSNYSQETSNYFVYKPNYPGTKKVYRLVNAKTGDYLLTTNLTERDQAVSLYGYAYEGVVFNAK